MYDRNYGIYHFQYFPKALVLLNCFNLGGDLGIFSGFFSFCFIFSDFGGLSEHDNCWFVQGTTVGLQKTCLIWDSVFKAFFLCLSWNKDVCFKVV